MNIYFEINHYHFFVLLRLELRVCIMLTFMFSQQWSANISQSQLFLYDAYHIQPGMNEYFNVSESLLWSYNYFRESRISLIYQLDFGNGSTFIYVSAFDRNWFVDEMVRRDA